jgi:hypothetical protein
MLRQFVILIFMKTKSYVFLFILLLILFFILGVRYGQRVEKNNKVVDYILKLPSPTPPIPSPTPTPLTYQEYKSKKYGLKFTYPSNLEVKESTKSPEVLFEIKK